MSFDKETRNALSKMVATCRRLLTEDVTDQLRGRFGMHPDGTILSVDRLDLAEDEKVAAESLRELLEHFAGGEASHAGERSRRAYDRLVLEISFTALNRLAALRLSEERDLVVECVRQGTASAGFQMFERVSGGALGTRYQNYRVFLECLFDELALDLGVLFDRFTPQSVVFPGERCLTDILAELNKSDLAHLWAADETIGWIYQYFNPSEERRAMRDASQAPRNSRELAVRNQFFTPRYVVEFLTDNTLGRIWYEMRKGQTALKEKCRYLVRRPSEVFLASGEKAPKTAVEDAVLPQEELLKQPVHIEHRPKKDPRDLRVLDPACGSGHFLLYTFDLLERIYEEAWTDADAPRFEATGKTLREEHKTPDDLRRALPKLVVEHNLHGIDIDPRAVQIAALALWLRAQKAWKALGLRPAERPRIERSNIVTAEPMPGEDDMRREFTAGLSPRVLGQLLDVVFDKMKLAGEAGSLLRIEDEIRDVVAAAKRQWLEGPTPTQTVLFPELARPTEKQQVFFDVEDITDDQFWEHAEDLIVAAMRSHAEQAENGRAVRRRLFAEDAARGFAFIDLCRRRYDVILMNPPFGLPPKDVFEYLKTAYADTYVDLYACFATRGVGLAPCGGTGAITSRAFLTTKKLVRWRSTEVLERIHVLLDLGLGVMDDAFVEACAYVLFDRPLTTFLAVSRREAPEKAEPLPNPQSSETHLVSRADIRSLPSAKILYSVSPDIHSLLRMKDVFEPRIGTAREGLRTFDDFRFLRLRWETPPSHIGAGSMWEPLAKGGEFARYYSDLHLLVCWDGDGRQLAEENRKVNGQVAQSRQASKYYRRAGGTYSKRSAKGFSVRALPSGCIIGTKGPAVLSESDVDPAYLIGWLNSRLIRSLIHIQANAFEFNTGILKRLPWVRPCNTQQAHLIHEVKKAIMARRERARRNEINSCFTAVPIASSFVDMVDERVRMSGEAASIVAATMDLWDEEMDRLYCVDSRRVGAASESDESDPGAGDSTEETADEEPEELMVATESDRRGCVFEAISYCVGTCLGRWDVRIGKDSSLAPELPGPFDSLPVCPPGMLVGSEGRPARANGIASEEWLRARPGADALPSESAVNSPTIADSEYPIRVSWNGVLVDDPGCNGGQAHCDDIVRRVREVFDSLWNDKAHKIEQEACEILGVKDLRDYFRRSSCFFQDHLKCHSKSRRKAPIYLPLSTASGSYTIWIYYHRLTDQTLYTAVNKYLEPKIADVERVTGRIEKELESTSGGQATQLRDRLNEGRALAGELRDLRQELLGIASLPYKPNLNDGVIINAAPLHKLFGLRSWAKDTERVWKKLEKGEYDWAHLAYTLWPDRVREACREDRSIAIAHGLEDLCEIEVPSAKGRGRKKGRKNKEVEQ